jgi:Zn-finger nucleic acid-binding protein
MMPKKPMCPKYCGVPLEPVEVGDLKVDQCPCCDGVWLDAKGDELFGVLRLGRGASEQLLKSWNRDKVRVPRKRGERYNCPRCGRETRAGWFGPKGMEGLTFVTDSCPAGCGVWLDDGELNMARSFIAETAPEMLAQVEKPEGLLRALFRMFRA